MTRAKPYDREAALDAALALFWRKGWHATSLKDLEAALAMKPGSIYAAFKSKEALFLAALDRYRDRSRARLAARMAGADTVLGGLADHLRGFGAAGGEGAAEPPMCMIVKTMLETQAGDGAVAERARDYYDAMRAAFAERFREAQAAGELPGDADPELLARRYQGEITALRLEAHRGAAPDARAAMAEAMAAEVEGLGRAPA
ncbi:TetR/AcrR family transcriptional regulator [Rhodovulum sp. DZ06]|uniref:TetR/AcrR family transcriptional regulator n=1 Tax=Rhodovulum sp. DZ06 TaxID=3425126 RepID=UPI003D3402AF